MRSDLFSDGETIHLLCRVKVFPQPSIVWIMRESTISRVLHTTSRVSLLGTRSFIENSEPYSRSDLYIHNVTSEDSGDYTCIIDADSHAVVQMNTHTITIICKRISTAYRCVIACTCSLRMITLCCIQQLTSVSNFPLLAQTVQHVLNWMVVISVCVQEVIPEDIVLKVCYCGNVFDIV